MGEHVIGDRPSSYVTQIGQRKPRSGREAPEINGEPLFTGPFVGCTSQPSRSNGLICTRDIFANESSVQSGLEFRGLRRQDLEPLSLQEREDFPDHGLSKRAGHTGGKARSYDVYEAPEAVGRPTRGVQFPTPAYPNKEDGVPLDEANSESTSKDVRASSADHCTGRNERYAIAGPSNCSQTAVTANGVEGQHWTTMNSDHPDDVSIYPNHFLNFIQTGKFPQVT